MPTITQLKIQKRDKDRVSVFLDDEYAFSVGILSASALRRGQALSHSEIADLRLEGETHLAYQKTLRFLGYRPRSTAEVERYLRDKGVDADIVGEVVVKLTDQGYLDDLAFARYWVENREKFRPRGRRALAYELWQKGVSQSDIDAALESLEETESAWAAISGKLYRWGGLDEYEFKQKALGYLSRRGFPYSVGREVANKAWNESQQIS